MAAFLRKCIAGIENGTIDKSEKHRLWCFFAPTSDWDDMLVNVDLGNRVFWLLDALYGREIKAA